MLFNILSDFNKESYPNKTNVLCYHCCHKFTTQPVSMPFLHEKNRFYVKYVFCGWECMKTYNSVINSSTMNNNFSLIQKMYTEITGKTDSISFAPHKCMLKDFGGNMTIKEFRNGNKNISYNLIEFPITVENPCVEKLDNFSWIKEDSAKDSYKNHTVTSKFSDTKLARPKSSKKTSTLENSMGLHRV